MTNFEHIRQLSDRELAWFLMAYSDPCKTCIHKSFEKCSHKGGTCIGNTLAWVQRESTKEDLIAYELSKRNVKVDDRNIKIEEWNKMVFQGAATDADWERLFGGESGND